MCGLTDARAQDFLRPIITPYELEIALKAEQSWTGRYVLDFERLLNAGPSGMLPSSSVFPPRRLSVISFAEESPESREADEEDPDQPVFSMVTGKYRHAKRYGGASRYPYPCMTAPLLRTLLAGEEVPSSAADENTSALVRRNQDGAVAKMQDNAAGA